MRLIATDLDGTLLGPDRELSPFTLRALRACRAQDVEIVFVTGRPLRWMGEIAQEVNGVVPVALCSNGALDVELTTMRPLRVRPFGPGEVEFVLTALSSVIADAAFAVETPDGPLWQLGYPQREQLLPSPQRLDLEELLASSANAAVVKVLCHSSSLNSDELLRRGRSVLAGAGEPVHSDPLSQLLEIGPPGVSKALALADYAHSRGIAAADVVAFGDMPNDVPMLAWAGRSYAMADGHAEARAAASGLAPASAQDGVAQVLFELLG